MEKRRIFSKIFSILTRIKWVFLKTVQHRQNYWKIRFTKLFTSRISSGFFFNRKMLFNACFRSLKVKFSKSRYRALCQRHSRRKRAERYDTDLYTLYPFLTYREKCDLFFFNPLLLYMSKEYVNRHRTLPNFLLKAEKKTTSFSLLNVYFQRFFKSD